MSNQAAEAIVVGAGPVGLTMAATLTQHGLKCRIIDKAPAPSDKSKALVVWSRTLELLDDLELAPRFIADGMKIKGGSIYGDGKRIVHVTMAGVDSPYGFPLMIPQNETERLLTEHLARKGVAIERQIELLSFSEQPDAVVGKLRHADGNEESFETPWLIGCDGAHSTVRHELGLEFTGESEQNDWLLADVHLAGDLAKDEFSVFWHEDGVLVFFPITETRFRVIADVGAAAGSGAPPAPTLAEVQATIDQRGPGGLTISEPIWLAGFRINERKVSDYRRGRVIVAGDAAHIHSPAGGQGMNTGMQDAFNLGWKIALVQRGQGQAEPLLGSYSVERCAVGDQVLRGASVLTHVATLRNPVAQFARNHVAGLLSSFGFVQDKFRNQLCELSINYRHSPLSTNDWPHLTGGLHAGDRLPDAPLTNATIGSQTTLYAAIRGTRHKLLLLPGSSDPQGTTPMIAIATGAQQAFPDVLAPHLILRSGEDVAGSKSNFPTWLDAAGKIHEQLAATHNTLLLVRPDGYIGFRSQPADGEALTKYLGQYLTGASAGPNENRHSGIGGAPVALCR